MPINKYFHDAIDTNRIDSELYTTYNVKKGLRNEDGTGVLIGLTKIADVTGYERIDGKKVDCEGNLTYRGYAIRDLINGLSDKPNGFEEISFLLLIGHLPNEEELEEYTKALHSEYELPEGFFTHNILRYPSMNLMNKSQRSLLMLYEYDEDPDNVEPAEVFRKGLSIVAKMPSIIAYAYQAKRHILNHKSLYIHRPKEELTVAENILRMVRSDKQFTPLEAKVLDVLLVLHLDHGSGNNSTFTNLVVSSTATDIYSAMSASVGSLKGPRHGGANLSAFQMVKEAVETVGLNASDEDITAYINKVLNKEAYDHSGLVYGFGHAVYTLSDPRAEIIREYAEKLAEEKGKSDLYTFYTRFEKLAKKAIANKIGKNVCANVDFYSGMVYDMLEINEDLFSPMFVTARMVGWLAHNIEDKLYCNKIIRPAGMYVGQINEYIDKEDR